MYCSCQDIAPLACEPLQLEQFQFLQFFFTAMYRFKPYYIRVEEEERKYDSQQMSEKERH